MKPEAVSQGECECGKSDDNYTITERNLIDEGLFLAVRCTCGQETAIVIPEDDSGLHSDGHISWEDASWNQEAEA